MLISAGIDPPRWHNIHDLIDLLPPDHRLKAKLEPLGRFTPFAIAYRYPAQDPDVLPTEPSRDEILAWRRELDELKSMVAATIRGQS